MTVNVRRRRYFLLRVADEPVVDMSLFLRGRFELRGEPKCSLLCPVRGHTLALTASDVALAMKVPADHWACINELTDVDAEERERILDLAGRGILLSDPAPEAWQDLSAGEDDLHRMQWHDLAAVYHAHSGWAGVVGNNVDRDATEASLHGVHTSRKARTDPPPHFVERLDADVRLHLKQPALEGAFFDTLRARRTTRAYRSQEPLALDALEVVLYAVFGAHGIKHVAPNVALLKRTSPSGGALHPIEAYVLAINVAEIPTGLYHYEVSTHSLARLEVMSITEARELAREFTAGQSYFAEAHALIVHVARFDRKFWKYAQHRKAYKSMFMDSAHLSQTLYLTATHLGLGAFYTAAINDLDIARRLRLRALHEAPVAISGIGVPDADRDELQFVVEPYSPAAVRSPAA